MSLAGRRLMVLLAAALLLSGRSATLHAAIAGPGDLPAQLPGWWRVSLCSACGHTWIRFEHADTGELHTLGRYTKAFGGEFDWRTGRWVWPHAPACGVIWDIDLKFDVGVRTDGRILRTCYVCNPRIYRGRANGYGHCGVRMNCTTYARDAWYFYAGEWHDLPPIALPSALAKSVIRRRG
jgi:hypothetical protein